MLVTQAVCIAWYGASENPFSKICTDTLWRYQLLTRDRLMSQVYCLFNFFTGMILQQMTHMQEAILFSSLHGYFLAGWHILTDRLLPVFSQSKINGCFSDITVPTWMNSHVQPVQQDEVCAWLCLSAQLHIKGRGGNLRNLITLILSV